MATITTLGFTIFSTYDGRGTTSARRDINSLTSDVQRNNVAMRGGITGMQALATAAVALTPALVPISAAAAAVTASTLAMGASAGAALGIYGLSMKKATTEALKLDKAHKQLNPSQKAFVDSVHQMKAAMDGASTGTMSLTLKTATVVTQGLTAVIKGMVPVIKAVHPLILGVAEDFKKWATGSGMDRFVQTIEKYGVPALQHLFNAGKAVIGFLGIGFRTFAPLGVQVAQALERGALALKGWAEGGGFQRFLQYVNQNSGAVKQFLTALGQALLQIGRAMKDMGPWSLAVATALAQIVAACPPSLITAMAYAFIAWRTAMVGLLIIGQITTLVRGMITAITALRSAWFILSIAFTSTPLGWIVLAIGAVIAAIVLIATKTTWFQTAWKASWNAIKVAGEAVWNALKVAWSAFISAMQTAWTSTSGALRTAWTATWNAIKTAGEAVWNAIKAAWQAVAGALTTAWNATASALKTAWNATWNAIKTAGEAVWNAIKAAWTAVGNALKATWTAVSSALKTAWQAAWNAMKTAAEAVWNALKTAWTAFTNAVKSVWAAASSALKTAWSAAWNAIKTAAETIWNALKTAWTTFTNAIKTVLNAMISAVKSVWSTFWNGLHTVAKGVWDLIQKGWDNLSSGVQKTLSGLVSKAKDIWNGIVNVFKTPVNAVIGIWDAVAGAVGLPKIDKLAAGGEVGGVGHSTSDNIPALLSPGEFVMPASAVRRYGLDTMEDMRRHRFAAGGVVGMAAGGLPSIHIPIPDPIKDVVGGVVGGVKDVVTGAGSVAGAVLDKLKDIAGDVVYNVAKPLLDAVVNKIPHPIPGVNTPAGNVPWAAAKKIVDSALSILKKKQEEAKAIGGVIPAGQHKAIIDAALKAAGVPPPGTMAEWEAGLNTLITRESAWNSGAINRTDSNAAAGHPSQGLAQTIPSTFAAYHVPGTSNNILDPVANVAAAIRYIVARYGNITNVQQANANLPPKGYWTGTGNAVSGWKVFGEHGPELVYSRGGERVLDAGATRKAISGRHHGDGDVSFSEGAFHFDFRGAHVTKEALQYAEGEMCDKLRMAVQAGVGKRGY